VAWHPTGPLERVTLPPTCTVVGLTVRRDGRHGWAEGVPHAVVEKVQAAKTTKSARSPCDFAAKERSLSDSVVPR
jgi:hypothetical protein